LKDGKGKDWTSTSIRNEQYNGLRLLAFIDQRPVARKLDLLLQGLGVPELSEQELQSREAQVEEHRSRKAMEVAVR
jgi:hypothetical protein